LTTARLLENLSPLQRRDQDVMISQMHKRCEEFRMAPSEAKRREAAEWVLRVAAEIYAWSK